MSQDCNANNGFGAENFTNKKSIEDLTSDMITNHTKDMENTLKALNLQACKTNTTAGGIAGITLAGIGAGGLATATSIGCETVAVQTAMSICLNKALQCAVLDITNEQSGTSKSSIDVKVKISGEEIIGNKIKISNITQNTYSIIDFTNTNVKAKFQENINSVVDSFQKAAQNSKNGIFSNQSSQRVIQDQISSLSTEIRDVQVTNIVQQTINQVYDQQKNTVTIGSDYTKKVMNNEIEITNNIAQDFIIQQIQNNTLDSVFKNTIKTEQKNQQEDDQKQKNQGLFDGIFSGFLSLIVAVVVIMIIIRVIKGQGGAGGGCGSTFLLKTCGFLSAILLIFGVGMLIWGYIIKRSSSKTIGIIFISLGFLLIIISIALTIFYNKKCGTQKKQIKMQKIQPKS